MLLNIYQNSPFLKEYVSIFMPNSRIKLPYVSKTAYLNCFVKFHHQLNRSDDDIVQLSQIDSAAGAD